MLYGLIRSNERNGDLILLKVCCWLLTVIAFALPRKTIVISKRRCLYFWPVLTAIFNCSLSFSIDVNHRDVSTFVCFYTDVFTTVDTLRVWAVEDNNNNNNNNNPKLSNFRKKLDHHVRRIRNTYLYINVSSSSSRSSSVCLHTSS